MWPFERRSKKKRRVWTDRRLCPASRQNGPGKRSGQERRAGIGRRVHWVDHRKGQGWWKSPEA